MGARHFLRQASKFARLALGRRADLPREIQLEVTNRCNLDCDMCPRLTLLKVPEVDMTWETFTAILDRLEAPESITLTGWGEPLMHPRFFDFIAEIRRRFPSCDVSFTTNAHLLTDAMNEKIIASGVSRVNVSLEELPWSGAEARVTTSNPLKGHDNAVAKDGHPTPQKVVDRLRRFLDAANSGSSIASSKAAVIEVRMQVVLFPKGMDTLLRLVDFAAEAGFHAVNLVRLDVRGRPDLARPTWDEERAMIAAARARAAERGIPLGSVNDHGMILRLASHADSFCVRLDNYVYVDVAGNVAPCCLLRGHRCGNLVEQPLREVWHGERLRSFYEPALARGPEAAPSAPGAPGPGVHPACQGCDAFLNCYAEPPARRLPVLAVGGQ